MSAVEGSVEHGARTAEGRTSGKQSPADCCCAAGGARPTLILWGCHGAQDWGAYRTKGLGDT